MSEQQKTPFLDMFPFCEGLSGMCGGLDKAEVLAATVSKEKLSMAIEARFARPAAPAEKHTIEGRIADEYGLSSVSIKSVSAAPAAQSAEKKPAAQSGTGAKKPVARTPRAGYSGRP